MLLATHTPDHKCLVTDAASRDQTGTFRIRGSLRGDLTRRWAEVRRALSIVVETGVLGPTLSTGTSAIKVQNFQTWLDSIMANAVLGRDGSWMLGYVMRGYAKGILAGGGVDPQNGKVDLLLKSAFAELQGIVEAASQQAVRTVAEGELRSLKSSRVVAEVRRRLDTIGRTRSRSLANWVVISAHAEGTLDALEARGISHVSIVPEIVPAQIRSTDALTHLFDAKRRSKKAVNLFARRGGRLSPISLFQRREKRLGQLEGEQVNVLTKEDDQVCPVCEEIAANGPYSIDGARGLIPAHPNCRCKFVVGIVSDANPNHLPAGPKGGQFWSGVGTPEAKNAEQGIDKLRPDQMGSQYVQSGFKRLDQELDRIWPSTWDALAKKAQSSPFKEVRLASLQTLQPLVDPTRLRDLIGGAKVNLEGADGAILVANVNGKNVLVDGNHRATLDRLAGKTTTTARVYNAGTVKLDEHDQIVRANRKLQDANPNHLPAGNEHGGEFTYAEEGDKLLQLDELRKRSLTDGDIVVIGAAAAADANWDPALHPRDPDGRWARVGFEGNAGRLDPQHHELMMQSVTGSPTDAEIKAAEAYANYEEFQETNAKLRAGAGLTKDEGTLVKNFTSLINKSTLPRDTTLYRGINLGFDETSSFGQDPVKLGRTLETIKPGDTLTDRGFMSTSTGTAARDYAEGEVAAVFEIRAKAGTKALPLHTSQGEIVLQRGTTLRLIEKHSTTYVFETAGQA